MSETWEPLVRAVCDAWANMPQTKKAALMVEHPDLYWAVAKLAGHGRFTFHLD